MTRTIDFLADTGANIVECKTNRGSYDRSYDTSTVFLACLETLKGKVLSKTSSDPSFTGQVRISTERRTGKGREKEMQLGGKDFAGAAHNFARKFDIQNRKWTMLLYTSSTDAVAVHLYRYIEDVALQKFPRLNDSHFTTTFTISPNFSIKFFSNLLLEFTTLTIRYNVSSSIISIYRSYMRNSDPARPIRCTVTINITLYSETN